MFVPAQFPKTALVTAGGTREPIDDVRRVTNNSTGNFGLVIARELASRGLETTVIASPPAQELVRKDDRFKVVPFESFADLRERLHSFKSSPPNILMMAAAVSDYSPIPAEGKISSDPEEIVIRLRRNPKLLDTLRELYGVETFIAGFKLTSQLSDAELVEKALKQVLRSRTNLTIGNERTKLSKENNRHPVVMVTPEGGAIPLDGSREQVARGLIDFILKRYLVRWFKTKVNETAINTIDDLDNASDLLQFAQQAKLLTNKNGNISVRAAGGEQSKPRIIITPRGQDKSQIDVDSLHAATIDIASREILSTATLPGLKSSIDSGVHGMLYDYFPKIEALLHFHPGSHIVIPDVKTEFPYPCGTVEEAIEIYRCLTQAGHRPTNGFAVELASHGYLVALEQDSGGVQSLLAKWNRLNLAYRYHLKEVHEDQILEELVLHPIFVGSSLVGLLAKHSSGWSSVFLDPTQRRAGLGTKIADVLIARGDTIAVHDDCEVFEFYCKQGYQAVRDGKIQLLTPPSKRTDLIEAASISLVNVDANPRKVFLTERAVEPWKNCFSFPGGGAEGQEVSVETGLRELREETGIDASLYPISASRVVYVGSPDGDKAYRVNNHTILVQQDLPFEETAETGAKTGWYTYEETRGLQMGDGTRRILRELHQAGTL